MDRISPARVRAAHCAARVVFLVAPKPPPHQRSRSVGNHGTGFRWLVAHTPEILQAGSADRRRLADIPVRVLPDSIVSAISLPHRLDAASVRGLWGRRALGG